jgi:hypothetical protein
MLQKESSSPNYNSLIGIIILLLILFPYLFISQYCNPVTDDFTYAFKGKNLDFWNTYFGEYENWNGRYFSNFLVLINPIASDNFSLYKFIPILIIILTFFSLLYLIHQLCLNSIKFSSKIIYSLILLLIYLQTMPIISEGIYWYTGAVTYQVGTISTILFLGMLVQFYNSKYILNNKIIHCLMIVLLLFFGAGCNEVSMILLLEILFLILIHLYLLKKINKEILILFIFAFGFGCIVYFAPGNINREDNFEEKHQFFHSLFYSGAQTIRFFTIWLAGGSLLIASLLYYPICKKLSTEIPLFKNSFHIHPIIALLFSLSVIFIGAFLPYWSTGILGQHRTMNVSFFLFILSWFVFLTSFYNSNLLNWKIIHQKTRLILFLFLCFTLFFTNNGWNVFNDLYSGNAKSFDQQMNARYEKIKNMNENISLPMIKNPPKTLFVIDLSKNPHHWKNRSYTVFFEKTEYLIYREK